MLAILRVSARQGEANVLERGSMREYGEGEDGGRARCFVKTKKKIFVLFPDII